MDVLYSLVLVLLLAGLAFVGGQVVSLRMVFGAVVPGVALVVFLLGLIYRIALWARTPVPFRITTTCGQERSLPWIKANRLENPATTLAGVGRGGPEVGPVPPPFRDHNSGP